MSIAHTWHKQLKHIDRENVDFIIIIKLFHFLLTENDTFFCPRGRSDLSIGWSITLDCARRLPWLSWGYCYNKEVGVLQVDSLLL